MRIVQLGCGEDGKVGLKRRQIKKQMEIEGLQGLSLTTVYAILKKWKEHKTDGDLSHPIRVWIGVTNVICDFIDDEMDKNNEL